jgi:cytochrome b pre-mRNA-processing protein 3
MLDFLFRRLTAEPARGTALFDAVVKHARERHWYVEGEVPDTLDGRFAVLATIAALVIARLEAEGDAGNQAAVALTERFIEAMEGEHRELGMGDPTLGRTVRRLVGSLARRTELWRSVDSTAAEAMRATTTSLYKAEVPPEALEHSTRALDGLRERLKALPLADIGDGKF